MSQLPTLPGINALSLATRYIDGGRDRFYAFIQMAAQNGNAHATNFLLVLADLSPRERMMVSLDDVCAAAGVRPADLMSAVVSTAMEYGTDVANLVAAATHPAIVHQAAKSAKRIGGQFAEIAQRDRLMMLQAKGFAPVPKSSSIHVHANATAGAAAATGAAVGEAATSTVPGTLPAFAHSIAALGTARQSVQHQLTAGDASLEPIEATVTDAVEIER